MREGERGREMEREGERGGERVREGERGGERGRERERECKDKSGNMYCKVHSALGESERKME